MGYFAGIVICDLQEHSNEIETHIRIIDFPDNTFVSWQTEQINDKKNWQSNLQQTIFFKKMTNVNSFSYKAETMIRKILVGVIKKKEIFEIEPKFDNFPSNSLIHMILPDSYIPITKSFKNIPHIKKKGNRLAITWPFEEYTEEKFRFHKVTKDEFEKFNTAGMSIEMKISPEVKDTLQSLGTKAYDEFKDGATETSAKLLQKLIEGT